MRLPIRAEQPKHKAMRIFERTALPKTVLFLCILLHMAVTLTYAITQHYELKTFGLDGAAFVQLMHNVTHAKGLTSSLAAPFVPQHWFGFHFSPILYLLVPFYLLCPSVHIFLAIGSVTVALAAWPIFLVARKILDSSPRALLIAILYLINPFVFNGVLHDFHEIDIAPLCLATMLWAVVERKRNLLLLLSIVLVCIKEHYGLSVAGFGMLWAWQWKEPKFGLSLSLLGIAVLCIVLFAVMPHYNPQGVAAMLNNASSVDRFSWISSKEGIAAHLPAFATGALLYGLALLVPFLLLPLAGFMWLLPAMADVGANILSQDAMMRSSLSYHSIAIIPVVAIACCHAFRRFIPQGKSGDVMLALVVASGCFSLLFSNLPTQMIGMNSWELSAPKLAYDTEDAEAIAAINQLITIDASVSAQANILPHLAARFEAVPYPFIGNANYIVLHLAFPFQYSLSVLGVPYGTQGEYYFSNTEALMDDKAWGTVYYSNRWVVMQKHAKDSPHARQAMLAGLEKLKQEYAYVQHKMQKVRLNPS